MTTLTADLQITNLQLSGLAARRYAKDWTPVPNSALPKEVRSTLAKVYTALCGKELQLDDNTLLVQSSGQSFERLYAPKLYKTADGVMFLKWGESERIAIELTDEGTLQPTDKSVKAKEKVLMTFSTANFSGKGEDAALSISYIVSKDEIYKTKVSVGCVSYKDYKADDWNTAVSTSDSETLLALLSEEKSGGSKDLPQVDIRAVMSTADPQVTEVELTVLGFKEIKITKGGPRTARILAIQGDPQCGVDAFATDFQDWATPAANVVLGSDSVRDIVESTSVSEFVFTDTVKLVAPAGGVKWYLVLPFVQSDPDALNLDF